MAKKVDISDLHIEVEARCHALFQAIADEAQQYVVQASPVKSGAFRASIRTGVNEKVGAWDKNVTDPSGQSTIRNNTQTIKQAKPGDEITIATDAPYAQKLEQGSSDQAPLGLFTLIGPSMRALIARAKRRMDTFR